MNWSQSDISEFQAGSFRFLLQKYYVKEWAENFMMHLMVGDADVWWEHIRKSGIIEKYPKIKADSPKMQPWGLRVLYLSDPSGVLWHIADNKNP